MFRISNYIFKVFLTSFAPAFEARTAVSTGSTLLLANTSAGIVVPNSTRTSVSSGETVSIRFMGSQDDHHQDSEEGKQELHLHYGTYSCRGYWTSSYRLKA